MSKTGKMLRLRQWKRGEKMKSGRKYEGCIDLICVDGNHYICRHSHRATHRTHPTKGERGKHFWRMLDVSQFIITKSIKAVMARVAERGSDQPVKAIETWDKPDASGADALEYLKKIRQEYPPELFQRQMLGGFERPVQVVAPPPLPDHMRDVVALYGEHVHAMPIITDHMQILPCTMAEESNS